MSDTAKLSQSGDVATYGHAMLDGRLVIETVQDVGPVLERCQQARNDGVQSVLGRDTRQIAEIPIVILEKMQELFGLDWTNKAHRPAIMNHVKFGDFRKFLTTDARLKRG